MKILLHMCCGNCAIYPSKTLREEGHDITGFWFNPNIHPSKEYKSRLDSLKWLAHRWRIDMYFIDEYKPAEFFKMFKSPYPLDNLPCPPLVKGGKRGFERCKYCYRLRLEKTAQEASRHGFNAFTTTLLISPYQNLEQIAAIGNEFADKYNILFYFRDFRPHFRESITIAKELSIYRQKYCGCIYSREEKAQSSKLKTQNCRKNFKL